MIKSKSEKRKDMLYSYRTWLGKAVTQIPTEDLVCDATFRLHVKLSQPVFDCEYSL